MYVHLQTYSYQRHGQIAESAHFDTYFVFTKPAVHQVISTFLRPLYRKLRAFKRAIEWASSLSIMDQPPKSKQQKQRFSDNEIDVLVHEVTANFKILQVRNSTPTQKHAKCHLDQNHKFQ